MKKSSSDRGVMDFKANYQEFMNFIGGVKFNDNRIRSQAKVYEKDHYGYIMIYSRDQAQKFAEKNNFRIGTVSVSDKGYERDGDSDSRFVSLYSYQTREYGTNIKKFFFYIEPVVASCEELD
jgi:hypothetical protein